MKLELTAFESFGGVPRHVVLDSIRVAIVHGARLQRSYRECAGYYVIYDPGGGRAALVARRVLQLITGRRDFAQ